MAGRPQDTAKVEYIEQDVPLGLVRREEPAQHRLQPWTGRLGRDGLDSQQEVSENRQIGVLRVGTFRLPEPLQVEVGVGGLLMPHAALLESLEAQDIEALVIARPIVFSADLALKAVVMIIMGEDQMPLEMSE